MPLSLLKQSPGPIGDLIKLRTELTRLRCALTGEIGETEPKRSRRAAAK